MEDFNHPSVYWGETAAGDKWSKGFLVCISSNFPTQVSERVIRGRALLGRLVWEVKIGAAVTAVTMRWWSSGSCKEGGWIKSGSQPCPSG